MKFLRIYSIVIIVFILIGNILGLLKENEDAHKLKSCIISILMILPVFIYIIKN